MDDHINPTLLLGIIGGVLLFAAATVINGTIWALSIEAATPARVADPTADKDTLTGDDGEVLERRALARTGKTEHWALAPRSNLPRSVPVDCVQPALGPRDDLLDTVCKLDL